MLIYEVLNNAQKKLLPILKDKRFARNAAETLLLHALNITREKLYIILRDEFPAKQRKKFEALVGRRIKGEPLQYLLGYWWFYGRKFRTKKGVLIPRQDTEAVIEVVKYLQPALASNTEAVDAGCGTGIIGITLKLEIPEIGSMTCVDTNKKAVELTKLNARKNNARIRVLKADFFALAGSQRHRFGLVVSNPPYIAKNVFWGLQREVKREPKSALLAGKSGLEYYIKFEQYAPFYLKHGAFLALEIGDGMGAAVRKVFKRRQWRYVRGFRDFRGKLRAIVFKFLG